MLDFLGSFFGESHHKKNILTCTQALGSTLARKVLWRPRAARVGALEPSHIANSVVLTRRARETFHFGVRAVRAMHRGGAFRNLLGMIANRDGAKNETRKWCNRRYLDSAALGSQ